MSIPLSFTHFVKGGLSSVYGYFVGAKGSELQVIDNTGNVTPITLAYAVDTGAADAAVITLSPAPTVYTKGMFIQFKAVADNTGACTVNVNGLGAKALKQGVSTDPGASYFKANGIVSAMYDGTNFQMIQPASQ